MLKIPRLIGITVENYRSFCSETEIELRPLTMFFGHNSVGKSALLRLLPILAGSVSYSGAGPINLQSDAARGAAFSDMQCKLTSAPSIFFKLTWNGEVSSAEYTVRDLPDLHRQVIERLVIRDNDGKRILQFEWLPSAESGELSRIYILSDETSSIESEVVFRGMSPEIINLDAQEKFGAISTQVNSQLSIFSYSTTWLKALRCLPPRREFLSSPLSGLSPDGSGITQMLAFDDLEGGATLTSVSNWYLNATGHRVELRWGAFAGKELFSVVLTPEETRSVQLDIVDTGEGMGQVLPVIGALCFAEHNSMKRNSIIAVEHPELHLHPSAHPSLAQLFCKLASGTQAPTLVVETHSEIFLLSVQLAIVAGDLDPKSVVVYWVKSSESGSEPVKVEFDEQGRPIGDTWPAGVFSESATQARELVLARRSLPHR
ncbi:AAA family ATPase [Paeniroseomonas aquatica]|uniref:AAA family ATPase n=1 Tax=Paeniroseomonas aquatica TaxID=373043 RepID=A0ABT7ZZE8_9PROT|nr:AAA family ATPase [Paeniroseomonas aquatica]MDN3562837.1 AAA family ATPase [Paeniroseomonas aquatica]